MVMQKWKATFGEICFAISDPLSIVYHIESGWHLRRICEDCDVTESDQKLRHRMLHHQMSPEMTL